MSGIIDFHSHVLPGIDDGSKSVEQSIAMLKREAEQGITHVVATPHFYPQEDRPEKFLRRREKAFEKVTGAAKGKGLVKGLFGIHLGLICGRLFGHGHTLPSCGGAAASSALSASYTSAGMAVSKPRSNAFFFCA